MKYRFLGHPDHILPNLINGKIYDLVVVTGWFSKKPRIVKPFYCPYTNWHNFYENWRPMSLETMRLERIDKEQK
jgi:hypothetical protein